MKLYELSDEIARIEDELADILDGEDEPEGGVDPAIAAALDRYDALVLQLDAKLSGMWRWLRNIDARATAVENEAKRLSARGRRLRRLHDGIKRYVAFCLGEGRKWEEPDGPAAFSWRRSEAVEVQDESAIPDCYCVFDRRPLLSEIKKGIKSGATVPGAALVQRMNLQVR